MDVVEETLDDKESKASLDIGALLIEARENRNWTSQDIANQMNLTLSMISKIEANDFNNGTPLAFIRGYVRSYAQKVGLDVENLSVEFDRQTQAFAEPIKSLKVVSSFKTKRREMNSSSSFFKFITFVIVTALIAFGGWELWKRLNLSQQQTPQLNEISLSTQQPKQPDNRPQIEESATDESATLVNQTPVATDAQIEEMVEFSQASAVAEQNQNLSQNQSDGLTLTNNSVADSEVLDDNLPARQLITGPLASVNFTFSADCWVKVTDANDEVLAIGIKREGKVMPLQGITPITVILGEPSAVTVEFEGQNYDLSRFDKRDTARFVLK